MPTQDKDLTSDESLRLLTLAVWNASADNDGDCPPEKVPVFRQLDDLISTTAWGEDARNEFFRRRHRNSAARRTKRLVERTE